MSGILCLLWFWVLGLWFCGKDLRRGCFEASIGEDFGMAVVALAKGVILCFVVVFQGGI